MVTEGNKRTTLREDAIAYLIDLCKEHPNYDNSPFTVECDDAGAFNLRGLCLLGFMQIVKAGPGIDPTYIITPKGYQQAEKGYDSKHKPFIEWQVHQDKNGVYLEGLCRREESGTPFGVFTIREGIDQNGNLDRKDEELARLIFKPQDAPPAIVHEPHCLMVSEFGAISVDIVFKAFAFGWACSQLNIDCVSWDVENDMKCDNSIVKSKMEKIIKSGELDKLKR